MTRRQPAWANRREAFGVWSVVYMVTGSIALPLSATIFDINAVFRRWPGAGLNSAPPVDQRGQRDRRQSVCPEHDVHRDPIQVQRMVAVCQWCSE